MNVTVRDETRPMLHLRIAGNSASLPLEQLDLCLDVCDEQIKAVVGSYLDLPAGYLQDYVVARHAHTIVVRPEAVYG